MILFIVRPGLDYAAVGVLPRAMLVMGDGHPRVISGLIFDQMQRFESAIRVALGRADWMCCGEAGDSADQLEIRNGFGMALADDASSREGTPWPVGIAARPPSATEVNGWAPAIPLVVQIQRTGRPRPLC